MVQVGAALVVGVETVARPDGGRAWATDVWGRLAASHRRVTVIAVDDRWLAAPYLVGASPFGLWMANSTAQPSDLGAAKARACELVALAPDHLLVDHLVVPGWNAARRHVRLRRYRDVLVVAPPCRLRDKLETRGWTKV